MNCHKQFKTIKSYIVQLSLQNIMRLRYVHCTSKRSLEVNIYEYIESTIRRESIDNIFRI